jgi:hypothetical protein
VAVFIVLIINSALLVLLVFKKNPNIIINNEHSPMVLPGNTKMLELNLNQDAACDNKKFYTPPSPKEAFNNPIPSFKDKPKPSGFGDIKNE